MLSPQALQEILDLHFDTDRIKSIKSLSGGCSDFTLKIDTQKNHYFLKYYSSRSSQVEANGLDLLRSTNTVNIPKVLGVGSKESYNYLLLEWIEAGRKASNYWELLGSELASLHKNIQPSFGLEYDNYIGRLPQINTYHRNWTMFFIECRLLPQIDKAKSQFSSKDMDLFDKLFLYLPDLLPQEKPSLLHGDLWSGNVLTGSDGSPALIDPATYYGNREIEIAFTYLFGGFDPRFYESYHSAFPLDKGFESRIDLYNLYPLLVHVNMFGGGYKNQVSATLNKLACRF